MAYFAMAHFAMADVVFGLGIYLLSSSLGFLYLTNCIILNTFVT